MNYLLSVGFSAGLAAVLLGAAAIILIVMIVEAVCMARLQKVKNNNVDFKAAPFRQPPVFIAAEETDGVAASAETEKPQTVTDAKKRAKGAYDKSFTARLILSDGDTKELYSSLKNGLLEKGFQSRVCRRYESFRAVKKLAARLAIRGGGLCLFCALEPEEYFSVSDAVKDLSDKKSYKSTPLLCASYADGGERASNLLIESLAQKTGVQTAGYERQDFAALLQYEEFETLLAKGLITVKKRSGKTRKRQPRTPAGKPVKTAVETEFVKAVNTVKKKVKKKVKKPVKKVVNLDVVFSCFKDGENATFDEIKKRVFGNNSNVTYIKILGRGNAGKNITVTANAFSHRAEKNILDAGGKVIIKND